MSIRIARPIFSLLLLACPVGCGADDDDEFELRQLPACKSDFEATIHEGPDAGLQLLGALTLVQDEGGGFGVLTPHNGDPELLVSATHEDGEVGLKFWLPDGRAVRGTGTLTEELAACTQAMEGSAVGPDPEDRGDWLTLPENFFECASRCYFRFPTSSGCSNICLITTGNSSGGAYNNCYDDCIDDPAVYRCDTTATFFDPCRTL